jgi:hypothetical protein
MRMEHDLAVLKKMADDLDQYLLADVLFWQMQAPSDFPKLSLGMLLLTRARLRAVDDRLEPDQRAERDQAAQKVETALAHWQVAAERKAERELRSRANLWQRFWDECGEQPGACADNYRNEVTQRVIAELLMREFPRLAGSAEARPFSALDSSLRGRLQPGDFIWDDALQPGFPTNPFWYLYGLPRR